MTKLKLTALLACMLSSVAYADTDVKLYGKVDLAMQYMKAPGKSAVVSMENQTSRWGLMIKEQLNADWAVKAYLEAGFSADTGAESTAGVAFARRSILAIYNDKIGEIGFGRMGTVQSISSPYGIGLPNIDPFRTAYGPAYEIEGSIAGDGRVNNAIAWLSNKMNGLRIGVSYSLGTDSDDCTVPQNNRAISLAVNYEVGPLLIDFGGSQFRWGKLPASSFSKTISKADAAKLGNRKNSEEYFAGFRLNATDSTTLYFAAQYMKNWRTFYYWMPKNEAVKGDSTTAGNQNGVDGWGLNLGFRQKLSGNLTWVGAAGYTDASLKTAQGVKENGERLRFATALEYSLTKRTSVYATAAYGRNYGQLIKYSGGKNLYTGMVGMAHWF